MHNGQNTQNSFLAMLFRMKHINRWSLMFNTQTENLMQHTVECAFIAHFLALVGNSRFGKSYNAEKVCVHALFHDVSEVLTGDLPTPVKYFNSDIKTAYKDIERIANDKLLSHLPKELRGIYSDYFNYAELTAEEKGLIKTADKLCAYIKCITELNASNNEFKPACESIKRRLEKVGADNGMSEELRYFLDNCLESFSLSLDDLKGTL